MTTDVNINDLVTPTLDVYPYAVGTAATLAIVAPDATATTGGHPTSTTVTADVDGVSRTVQRWTCDQLTLDQAGWWTLTWTVTGTGAGEETQRILVADAPAAGLAPWTPTRAQVADHIPGRTVSQTTPTEHLSTFTDDTRPTGEQVDRLITEAVQWVWVKTGDVDEDLYGMASATVAVYAAAMVERGYPDRNADVDTGKQLYDQAVSMRADLDAANKALSGTDVTDPAALVPLYAFPAAPDWADLDL